jgi:hypothetical protein
MSRQCGDSHNRSRRRLPLSVPAIPCGAFHVTERHVSGISCSPSYPHNTIRILGSSPWAATLVLRAGTGSAAIAGETQRPVAPGRANHLPVSDTESGCAPPASEIRDTGTESLDEIFLSSSFLALASDSARKASRASPTVRVFFLVALHIDIHLEYLLPLRANESPNGVAIVLAIEHRKGNAGILCPLDDGGLFLPRRQVPYRMGSV